MKVKRTVGIALLGIGAVISVFFVFSMGHPTALSAAVSEARLEDLPLLVVIPLQAELGHVQGIATDGRRLWVTDVHRDTKTGTLSLFTLTSGDHLRTQEIQEGERYHPGGIVLDAVSIWVPVAEYTRQGKSNILRLDKDDFHLLSRFSVDDHIGCLALDGDRLIGGNWDSRIFYWWDLAGHELDHKSNPSLNRCQEIQIDRDFLVGSGLVGQGEGVIEWMDTKSLNVVRRLHCGKTDRGNEYTREGMTLFDGKLYLLPEDGHSRLFIYKMEKS